MSSADFTIYTPGAESLSYTIFASLHLTLLVIGCLDISDTQWLRSLVKGSIEAALFCK